MHSSSFAQCSQTADGPVLLDFVLHAGLIPVSGSAELPFLLGLSELQAGSGEKKIWLYENEIK